MKKLRNSHLTAIGFFIFFFVFFSGCFHRPNLSPENKLTDEDAILLIGIESSIPVRYLFLMHGRIEEDKLNVIVASKIINVEPKENFVIAKLSPTDNSSRYFIRLVNLGTSHSTYQNKPGDKAMAFEAVGGKILYPGTFVLEYKNNSISVIRTIEIDKAKQYLEKNYPHLIQSLIFKEPTIVELGSGTFF